MSKNAQLTNQTTMQYQSVHMSGFKRERELNVNSRYMKANESIGIDSFRLRSQPSDSKESRYRLQLAQVINGYQRGDIHGDRLPVPFSKSSPVVSKVTRCYKILDAPGLPKSSGAKVMSWGSHGLLIGLNDVIYRHNAQTGQTTRVLYGNKVRQVSWAAGAKFIAVVDQASSDCIVLADVEHGHLRNIPLNVVSTSMAISGKILAIGSTDNHVAFHDLRLKDSLVAKQGSESTPTSVSICELTGAVGDANGRVHVYDLRSMNKVSTTKIDNQPISDISWRSRRNLLIGGAAVSSLDLLSGSFSAKPESIEVCAPVSCLLVTNRGGFLTGHSNGIVCSRADSLRCVHSLVGDKDGLDSVFCIAEDPATGTVAVGYRDETIRFFVVPEISKADSAPQTNLDDLR